MRHPDVAEDSSESEDEDDADDDDEVITIYSIPACGN